MDILFTIDTEWDRLPQHSEESMQCKNLLAMTQLWKVFDDVGAKATFFCANEVIGKSEFEKFASNLVSLGKAEIGTHLHPWTTPPYNEFEKAFPYKGSFPTELSLSIFEEKLLHLKNNLEKRFHKQYVYRAGRFGISEDHIGILAKHGYLYDSSITPYVDWSRTAGMSPEAGPNHSSYSPFPFEWIVDGACIDEFPITILRRSPESYLGKLYNSLIKGKRNGDVLWLRPLPENRFSDFKRIVRRSKEMGLSTLVMFMHSNEFDPKRNPYFDSEIKVERMVKDLINFFIWIQNEGYNFRLFKDIASSKVAIINEKVS